MGSPPMAGGRLAGKVAVVTGVGAGIGRAVARRFVAEGARVVGGDIDEKALASLASELGSGFDGLRCDVTVEDDVAGLVARAVERFGRLDVAVANAGGAIPGEVTDLTYDAWRWVIDLSLNGVFLTVKHAGQVMKAAGGGSIVNLASLNAIQAGRGMGPYCAAKAGVVALTEVAALELGRSGVRVNAVAPGLVRTATTEALWKLPGAVEAYVENTPIGRFAEPDEIASLVLFLASDEAGFVSGSLYSIDGAAHTMRYPDLQAVHARIDGAS